MLLVFALLLCVITLYALPAAEPRHAELREVDGRIEVVVDGVVQSRMWGRLDLPGQNAPEKLDQYQGAGIDVYLTNVDLEWNIGWNGDDTYDFRPYEHHLDRIVARKPDIKLICYVGFPGAAPYTWCRNHEDELALLSNGDRLRMGSFASQRWLADATAAWRAWVRHFRASRFAANIIGVNPIMYSNEWHTPSSRGHEPLDDYSLPMQAHFRDWLRERYQGDAGALCRAWRVDGIDCATAAIPSVGRRLAKERAPLPFGQVDRWVLDYETCLNAAREAFIIAACQAVKEASEGGWLTALSRRDDSLRLLTSPAVDIFHGPYVYSNRKLVNVNGYSQQNYARHGKLGIYQIDTGTHVMPKTGGDALGIGWIWPGPFRLADDAWTSVELLRRDVSKAVADDRHVYWNDGGPGWMFPIVNHGTVTYGRHWFDTPEIKQLIADGRALIDRQHATAARSTAQVALVGSTYRRFLLQDVPAIRHLFNAARIEEALCRSGVTFHNLILEDLAGIPDGYAVYLFADAFALSEAERRAVQERLRAQHATAIWLFAPGFLDDDGADAARMRALTGLELEVVHRAGAVQARPVADEPWLAGVETFGSRTVRVTNNSDQPLDGWRQAYEERSLPCRVVCSGGTERVLARYEDDGAVAMAISQAPGYRSVWLGAPEAPWQLWHGLLRGLGVHTYAGEGDMLMANDRFVALYAITAGDKRITLPGPRRVFDAWSGALIAECATEIGFTARAGETRGFVLADPPKR